VPLLCAVGSRIFAGCCSSRLAHHSSRGPDAPTCPVQLCNCLHGLHEGRDSTRRHRRGGRRRACTGSASPDLARGSCRQLRRNRKERGRDSTLVTYVLTATADTTGWSITFPNRKPIPLRIVSVAGDSIVMDGGPYESAIKKGIMVTTNTVNRLENGKLVGRTVAHYATKGPDSVRIVMSEGVRK